MALKRMLRKYNQLVEGQKQISSRLPGGSTLLAHRGLLGLFFWLSRVPSMMREPVEATKIA
jgi:hypothetical protein